MNDTLEATLARQKAARDRLPSPEMRRLIRERAGESQVQLAAEVSTTGASISRFEAGHDPHDGELLVRYVEALDRLAVRATERLSMAPRVSEAQVG